MFTLISVVYPEKVCYDNAKGCVTMIDFHYADLMYKQRYEQILFSCPPRGCEYSFANLHLWGKQNIAFLQGCVGFFSHFNGRSVYPFPIGPGDRKAVIEAYLEDARQRDIPCRITGMTDTDREALEGWFPGVFTFRTDRDSFDYVYDIHDLADLRGRKYQKKRNHFNRFMAAHPDCRIEPLTRELVPAAAQIAAHWYTVREQNWTTGSYMLEKRAVRRCLRDLEALEMEGCVLFAGDEPIAMAIGSRLSHDTFDIHFEKAREDVDGAYAAINCEFARYLRLKYPGVQFLDREDDLGLEGLRKAKLSYLPHHLTQKHWAYLTEDLYED